MPEWPNGAGCKPVGIAYDGSNPSLPIIVFSLVVLWLANLNSSFYLEGFAHVAQGEERILGKDEVTGSNPVVGFLKG